MKRSEINYYIDEAITLCRERHFGLPPFTYWSAGDWQTKGHEYDEIRDCMLGWDLTDFARGDFEKTGLLLCTLRNGHPTLRRYTKQYCQKLLISRDQQVTALHYHLMKMEDIICHAGADLLVQVYNAAPDDSLADAPVPVMTDGCWREVPAGTILRLRPGESITLPQRQYHSFWADGGQALVVEVSTVNDDVTDNHFLESTARFPGLEEDEPARYLLCTEYPPAPG
jgi:D-lyxose ketol-isomerase